MLEQEIAAALDAHAQWTVRLKTAIDTGKLDTPIATIGKDDQCKFGKWLNGTTVSNALKQTPEYQEVKRLHAEFHRVAALVAQLASSGQKTEARKALSIGGAFSEASSALTTRLQSWKVR